MSVRVSLVVGVGLEGDAKRAALGAVNKKHAGSATVPLGAATTDAHQDALAAVCRGQTTTLLIDVDEQSGQWTVVGVTS